MKKPTIPDRMIIHARDVSNITGMSVRSGRRLLNQILMANDKPPGGFVTIKEFSEATLLSEEQIKNYMKD